MRQRILFAVLLLVGIGVGLWYGPALVLETQAVEAWEEVGATIESVAVERDSSGSGASREVDYEVVFSYRYDWGGQSYTGSRYQVACGLVVSTKAEAMELAQALRDEPRITVWVDPDDPTRSVKEKGGALYAWLTVGFGWVLIAAAGYVYFRRLRPQRGLQPGPSS